MRWREIKLRDYSTDLLIVFVVIAGAGVLWLTFFSENPFSFVIRMQQVITQKKRFLLHKIDHHALAQELRDLAEQQGWKDVDFNKDDPRLPAHVRSLKPSAVYIRNDHIIIDFGGPFDAMDIRAFKPGLEGYGTKKLGDGLWFYARSGSGPSE